MKNEKLIIPLAIIIASIILGGSYYLVEINKQESIERQQEMKLLENKIAEEKKEEQKRNEEFIRSQCAEEAEQAAVQQYKNLCAKNSYMNCKEGTYLVDNYENGYKICLQKYGLE